MRIALIKFPREIPNPVYLGFPGQKESLDCWIAPCLCHANIMYSGRAKGGICSECGFAVMTEVERTLFDTVVKVHTVVPLPYFIFKSI